MPRPPVKPNCTPLCDHTQVCRYCKRLRCVDNFNHNRLTGYSCLCGSREWFPLKAVPESERFVLSWDLITVDTQAPARFTVRELFQMVCQLPTETQTELVKQLLMRGVIYEDVRQWVK